MFAHAVPFSNTRKQFKSKHGCVVLWQRKRRHKFPEKKIFQFFRSTNHYSKLTSLIAAYQNHVVKFSKPKITWSLDIFGITLFLQAF